MENLIYDRRQKAEFCRAIAAEEGSTRVRWALERRAAVYEWHRSAKEHYVSRGEDYFDYEQWRVDRAQASAAWGEALSRHRRKCGDREIVERARRLAGRPRPAGRYRVTRARCRVIEAVVALASDSSMLYCSYAGLARRAGVSQTTAKTVRAELEALGALERVRTGGKRADGACESNRYIVKWCSLRDALGVANLWETSYTPERREAAALPVLRLMPNPYYNPRGFARHSASERQRRRVRQRLREAAALRAAAVENLVAADPEAIPALLENGSRLGFCPLTALTTHKRPYNLQPVSLPLSYGYSIVENGTPLRGSDYGNPADSNDSTPLRGSSERRPSGGCSALLPLSPDVRALVDRIRPERLPWLLAEAAAMTRHGQGGPTESNFIMVEHYLRIITDADPTALT